MVTMKDEVEPVGDVDVRFLALQDRAEEDDQIGDPDDRQPEIDVPFGLGIFAALGDAEQVAGRRHDDEQLVAPEHEPGEVAAEQAGAAGALHDVEGGGDQRVAAEGEDDRRGVQRPQAPEIEPGLEVEVGKGELERDHDADQEADHAPEHRGDRAVADRPVHVVRLLARRACAGAKLVSQQDDGAASEHEEQHPHMGAEQIVCGEAAPSRARNAPRLTTTISAL